MVQELKLWNAEEPLALASPFGPPAEFWLGKVKWQQTILGSTAKELPRPPFWKVRRLTDRLRDSLLDRLRP
jgi:hypothetical protein